MCKNHSLYINCFSSIYTHKSSVLPHANTPSPEITNGQNNAWSSDMTESIGHLIGHKLSQFQVLFSHFVKKKLKII